MDQWQENQYVASDIAMRKCATSSFLEKRWCFITMAFVWLRRLLWHCYRRPDSPTHPLSG